MSSQLVMYKRSRVSAGAPYTDCLPQVCFLLGATTVLEASDTMHFRYAESASCAWQLP